MRLIIMNITGEQKIESQEIIRGYNIDEVTKVTENIFDYGVTAAERPTILESLLIFNADENSLVTYDSVDYGDGKPTLRKHC